MEGFRLVLIIFGLLLAMVATPFVASSLRPGVSAELIEYVKSVKAKKQIYKENLPQSPKQKKIKYSAENFRDPFRLYVPKIARKHSGSMPNLNRKREPLESYPLESLEMVGTIEKSGVFYALLRDRKGMIYRAGVGNYVGQNSGKIESISMTEINIKQWVSDSRDDWRELPAKIFLKKALDRAVSDQK